jgi:hypothetical protein
MRFGFEPSRAEVAQIGEICRLVQGMPLGILLAASWIDTLSLPEIAGEIGKNIDFLQSEASDLPSRQHSIRAVFDHSWDLLRPDEQAVLSVVSIFRGGFTRVAAEAVARASLRTLSALVSKSLLRRVPETGRYEIHELLRQYAEGRLMASPAEHEAAMDRLATFYAGFLGERRASVLTAGRQQAFGEIHTDLDNIRGAWQWMVAHGQADRLLCSLQALAQFYMTRRSRPEAAELLGLTASAFASADGDGSVEARKVLGLALAYQALFCDMQGRKAAAVELVQRGAGIFSKLRRGRRPARGRGRSRRGPRHPSSGRRCRMVGALAHHVSPGPRRRVRRLQPRRGVSARGRRDPETHVRRAHRFFRQPGDPRPDP